MHERAIRVLDVDVASSLGAEHEREEVEERHAIFCLLVVWLFFATTSRTGQLEELGDRFV